MQPAQNRAIALWQNWEAKEKMLSEVFHNDKGHGNFEREKYECLSAGLARIAPLIAPDEKLVAALIGKSLKRLERQLYPNRFLRSAHRVKRVVFDRPMARLRLVSLRKENIAVLDSAIGKLGVDTARLDLSKALDFERNAMDFRLSSPLGRDKRFEVVLHLQKDDSGRFQFEGYTGKLKNALDTSKEKSFHFDAGLDISSREALNLLEGRAVLKDFDDFGEKKWLQLDFDGSSGTGVMRELGRSDSFNLGDQMEKMAESLKRPELREAYVLNALERGNQVVVNQVSGEKLFLEAAPLSGKIVFRDASQKVIALEKLLKKKEKSLALTPELKITRTKQRPQGKALGIA
ncbi:hypothetical protein [Pedobacter borealis]|uniref:hypothetical protein n=1 Tax=Pedobacter borealis TaxID=475254 RepID=UPI0004936CB0|nr:hypothetical protein [Pedobacter borealis]